MLSAIRFNALLLCLIFCVASCKKENSSPFPTPLPAATQVGAHTFGCKINGKAWVPDGVGGFAQIEAISGGYVGSSISPVRNSVFISTYRSDRTKIDLHIQAVNQPGVYQLDQRTGIIYAELRPLNYGAYFPDTGKAFVTNPTYTGTVTITRADTVNFIVSGTFEFTVYDPASKQTIRITDGRFDIDSKR